MVRAIAMSMVAVVLAGCSRKVPEIVATAPVATKSEATAPAGKSEGPHGSRKKKNIDVPVIVDGAYVATLRAGELPSAVGAHAKSASEAPRYYRLSEYLAAVGVPVAKVRAVHVRGNLARIASVEGDELRREPNRFVFDFLEGTTGVAKLAWDTTGLKNTFRVDEIRELIVFVDKSAPGVDARRSCYLVENKCSEAVPYAADLEIGKGTRVYLDGKLVGQVKRRRLSDDVVLGKTSDGATEFALGKLLAGFGVDATRVRGVDLVSGDDVVGRAGKDALAAAPAFVLPAHAHGRVRVNVPASWQASSREDRAADVTAVLVYQSTRPSARPLQTIDSLPASPRAEEPSPADDG